MAYKTLVSLLKRNARMSINSDTLLLSELRAGQGGEIVDFVNEGPSARHLLSLGFLPGENLNVVRIAPLGDPMIVRIGSNEISLRRRDASQIKIKK